ncbi:MAG TPA: sensor domain-containing diguanylate cyclase [bacterium]|nr:sensor domain-containing diguanylate cyclase [bacterium]
MILGPRGTLAVKTVAWLIAILAIGRSFFEPASLALLLAVPPLVAAGWRKAGAYLGSAIACAAVLAFAVALEALMGAGMQSIGLQAALLGLLGLSTWAGWLYLSSDTERAHAQRRVLEDLEEELVQLRVEQANQEKTLTIHENRRKRYSRLQEAVNAFASSLELEKLSGLLLAQVGQLLAGLKVDVTVFVMEGGGKELLRKSLSMDGGAVYPAGAKVQDDPLNAWVLAKAVSLIIKDLEKDFRFRGLDMAQFAGRSFHLLPLLSSQGQVAGLVRVESVERDVMDKEDQNLLESLVVLASLAFENARLYREAEELAVTDGLTRLMLRRPLMERLDLELKRAQEQGQPMSLVMLDIDHFKSVNDTYGHPAGDLVLREVAAVLKRSVRDVDLCGRYGGEEFVVLLPQTPLDGARLVAERVREAVAARGFELRGERRVITVSLGVATSPEHGAEARALIGAADEALYASKQAGRDRVTLAGGKP